MGGVLEICFGAGEPEPEAGKGKEPAPPAASKTKTIKPPQYTEKLKGEEALNFDYISLRDTRHRTTFIESVGHLIKSCLGAGIISVHETYKKNGLFSSLVMNFFLGTLVTYCMMVLVDCAQKMYGRVQVAVLSYPDLAEATIDIAPFPKLRKYAKAMRYAVDVTIMIDLFGSCCCYQVLMAKSMKDLAELGGVLKGLDVRIWLLFFIIPCILITWILHLKYLAPFSLFGDAVILVIAGCTVYYGSSSKIDPTSLPNYKSVTGLIGFIGAIVFTMEGVGVTLPIENHLKHPKQMKKVLWTGMFIVMTIVMLVGFCGYWGWGEKSQAPVTINFPQDAFAIVLRVCLLLMVFITFPLNFWIPFDLLWVYLKKRHPEEKHWFWHRFYRSIATVIISILSICFPEIVDLMSVIGAFCLSNMGFIYPAVFEILIDWEYPGLGKLKWRLWRCIIIVLFGIALFLIGTVMNTITLIEDLYGVSKENKLFD